MNLRFGLKKPNGALQALKKLNQLDDDRIRYVVPVEIGGLSSVVACLCTVELDMAVVDGNGAGRAVPVKTLDQRGRRPYRIRLDSI